VVRSRRTLAFNRVAVEGSATNSSCRFKMSSFVSPIRQSQFYPGTQLASIMLKHFATDVVEDSNG
jgi:hypothetical protein